MTTVFLFAHQDDEFGVFHEIASTLSRGERAVCVYLTNGAWKTVTPERRNAESSKVLRRMGLPPADMHFLGTDIGIASAALPDNFEKCWNALLPRISEISAIDRIVMHAYEGGHHDHDAAHLIGVALAAKLNVLPQSRQFPLYRAPGGRLIVTYAAPLEANGPVTRQPIPWSRRLKYLGLLGCYQSQWKTIVKMGPLMAWDFIADGCQKLQPVSLARITERPRNGELLYETWKLYSFETFARNAAAFTASIGGLKGENPRPA